MPPPSTGTESRLRLQSGEERVVDLAAHKKVAVRRPAN
jgi:hypothetical protein